MFYMLIILSPVSLTFLLSSNFMYQLEKKNVYKYYFHVVKLWEYVLKKKILKRRILVILDIMLLTTIRFLFRISNIFVS